MENIQAIESSIILTDKMFDEFNLINIKFDQNNKSHFRGKCGEIFLENGKYLINCSFCNSNFFDINTLITHNYLEHFKLKPPDIFEHLIDGDSDQPNQQQQETTPKQILQKEKLKNIKIEQIDDTEFLIMENKTEYKNEKEINNDKEIQITKNNKEIEIIENYNDLDELDICERPNKMEDKYGLYSCEYCARSYIHYTHLKFHYLEHNYPKEFNRLPIRKKICNDKSKYFINIDDKIKYHIEQMRRKPDDDGKFYCDVCTKKFTKFRYYRNHYLQVHQKLSNPYKCSYCPVTFLTRQTWIIHERIHTGEKPYQCSYCPRAFALYQNLKRHINIHLGAKPYSCSYCDRKFTQPQSKASHERNIHTKERPHQCELCGVTYPRPILLKEHYKRHTNTRPFECNICGKKYFDNAALKNHLYTHSSERMYDCTVCSKKFKNLKYLKSHRKIHSNTKKYQCKICDEIFTQNEGLDSHMKLSHNIMETEEDDIE